MGVIKELKGWINTFKRQTEGEEEVDYKNASYLYKYDNIVIHRISKNSYSQEKQILLGANCYKGNTDTYKEL